MPPRDAPIMCSSHKTFRAIFHRNKKGKASVLEAPNFDILSFKSSIILLLLAAKMLATPRLWSQLCSNGHFIFEHSDTNKHGPRVLAFILGPVPVKVKCHLSPHLLLYICCCSRSPLKDRNVSPTCSYLVQNEPQALICFNVAMFIRIDRVPLLHTYSFF